MSCHRCNRTPCHCGDVPLTTAPTDITCPTPQPCSEYVYSGCIVYNGPDICDFNITAGMTLNQIVQALIILTTDPGCMTTTCYSPFVQVTTITQTTIKVSWVLVAEAESYLVSYLDEGLSPAVWVDSAVLGPGISSYTITGLNCDTDYKIKVTAVFSDSQCESVTMCVTTLEC